MNETFQGNYSSVDIGPPLNNAFTPYHYQGGIVLKEGEYTIRKKTLGVNGWVDGSDHTGQGGYMMIVNTARTGDGKFYEVLLHDDCFTIDHTICFSIANLTSKSAGNTPNPRIIVEIKSSKDNYIVGKFTTAEAPKADSISWINYNLAFKLPKGEKSYKIILYHNVVSDGNNDFAIDDIRVNSNNPFLSLGVSYSGLINGSNLYPVYVCKGTMVQLTTNVPKEIAKDKQIVWYSSANGYSWDSIPGAHNVEYTIESAQRSDSRFYKLYLADSGNIDIPACRREIYVGGLRVDPDPVIRYKGPLCEGQPLNLSVSEGTNVHWSGPNGFLSSDPTPQIQSVSQANEGWYTATVSFNLNCKPEVTVSTYIPIRKSNLQLDLGPDTTLCNGDRLLLNAFNERATYSWNTGSQDATILATQPGTYHVIVRRDGCVKRDTIKVSFRQLPMVSAGKDTTICKGKSLLLKANIQDASSFQWQDGSRQNPIRIVESGKYRITARNQCGTASSEVNVFMMDCPDDIYLPNAFTPNHDGLNDVFKPKPLPGIAHYSLYIYNRWGSLIFESHDINKGWDGAGAPAGDYVWVVYLKKYEGKEYHKQGTVTVIY